MADRPTGYGMTADLTKKIDAKYSVDDERKVVAWIFQMVGEKPDKEGRESLHAFLKDGTVLMKLMNAIQPGTFKKITDSKMAFKCMERIGQFLDAMQKYGVVKSDSFQTVDLYENQNMPQVLTALHQLASVYTTKTGKPSIGVKLATANVRETDEEKLRAGRNIIGLQMGSNQGASQAGMTPYGLGRQLEKTNLKN